MLEDFHASQDNFPTPGGNNSRSHLCSLSFHTMNRKVFSKSFLKSSSLFALCSLLCVYYSTGFCQEKMIPVTIDGDEINYLQEKGEVAVSGNVKMKQKDVELFCDEANYNANSHIAHLKGNVKIIREDATTYVGDVIYDFNTHNAQMTDVRIEFPPNYGEAEKVEIKGEEKYVLKKGYVTTCDLKDPHYRLTARRIIVYPKERVVAKNMVLKVGNTPIFYLPYVSYSLRDESFPFQLIPGKDKEWGYYSLISWRYNFDEKNRGKIHTDWYEKRGLGIGVTHHAESQNFGKALLNYYTISDKLLRLEERTSFFEMYPERIGISSKYLLEDDRYKTQFSYSWEPASNLSLKSEFHKFSDENFMKDFFYQEYEVDPSPLSYTLIDYSFPHSSLSLLAQKRANRFFTETEYLPQLEHNFYKQELEGSNFYLESKSTLSNLGYKTANSDIDYDTLRIYSHNVLSYPKKIKWLQLNPYLGSYSSFYSKNKFGDDGIFREAFEAGADLTTKLYKYFDSSFNLFGREIDEMRHVLTPTVSYGYIHEPTVSNSNIFKFDSLDSLTRAAAVTFKLENKLQVKSNEKAWDFIYFSPSAVYQIDQEGKGSYFSTIGADLEVYPKEGISLTADTTYNVPTRRITAFNADLSIGDTSKEEKYSLSLGHRYSRQDSTQGTLDLTYKLTPKLQLKHYFRYEYNTGDLQKQQHSLRLDLHCWWMDFGVDVDKQREGFKDFAFWVMFRLKAFPGVQAGFDRSYHARKSKGRY